MWCRRMIAWICAGGFLVALFCGQGSAEVITTTHGKVFEGEVSKEKPRYIQIQTSDGGVYKIKKRHIRSRSSQVDESQEGDEQEEVVEHTVKDWENWREKNKFYLKKTMQLFIDYLRVVKALSTKVNDGGQIQKIRGDLDQLTPPEILQDYHNKFMLGLEQKIKSNKTWLMGDGNVHQWYHMKSVQSFSDAYEALKKAHQQMGASSNFIVNLEGQIKGFQQQLEQQFYFR